ncbi:MAG TPA: PhoPQ-activated pathogenicity-related family protein [Thermoanaerobaculia bacterium]|nr:PhoPQ-activated pathogenicity-related family protein [Thermoanaerobaculia bacterium]
MDHRTRAAGRSPRGPFAAAPLSLPSAHGRARAAALVCALSLAGAGAAFGAGESGAAAETALDRYVAKADPAYRFELASTIEGEGFRAHVLDLVSQSWRDPWEVDRTEWRHWVTIVVPAAVRHRTALLWIGGGDNDNPAPGRVAERSLRLALETGSVVADLGMVPNQPLFFADSKLEPRHEDDLIAYGRVKYIVTGDEEWLVRLPMVKSGVRAMDAIQEHLRSAAGGGIEIDRFVVAGGSKRGWTTWLVGAVDERVAAIVPVVIDALNTEAITRHHYEVYGFFSPALGDYVRHGLYPHLLGTDAFGRILAIEDPYLYRQRDRLRSIPKLLVNAAGDQFFLPDNSRFYFSDLEGEKHLRYVPNAKHNLAGSDAQDTILAFYRAVLTRAPRPRFAWRTLEDETIVVTAEDRPRDVRLWQATNPAARDFRLDVIGEVWESAPLPESAPLEWRASVAAPPSGFTAFFVELTYAGEAVGGGDAGAGAGAADARAAAAGATAGVAGTAPLKLTTDVSVVPQLLPFRLEEHTGPWLGER